MNELSKEEADLVHHVEVYGMNPTRAGQLLGIANPHDVLKKPHVVAARESLKRTHQAKKKITKADVQDGIIAAIQQGYDIGDPASQIRGWVEIAKMEGFYEPAKLDIRLEGTVREIRKSLAEIPDDELLKLVGPDANVIDVDFYRLEAPSDSDD